MKAKILLSSVIVAAFGITAYFCFEAPEATYQERDVQQSAKEKSWHRAAEYYKMIKGDPITGEIDPALVQQARKQVAAKRSEQKTNGILSFNSMGPFNQGGRTRSILIDKDDNSIIYAGSVAGGLWKSTDGGGTWNLVTGLSLNLCIGSMSQDASGNIFVGTGSYFETPSGIGSTGNLGNGIWKWTKSTNTWTHIKPGTVNSTGDPWNYINRLACHPTNSNILYAAIGYSGNGGLYCSTDGGLNWNPLFYIDCGVIDPPTIVDKTGGGYDVMVASNGDVVAVMYRGGDAAVWRSSDPTTPCSYTKVLSEGKFWRRTVIAQGYKDASGGDAGNYMYAMTVIDSTGFSDNQFEGLYQSTDYGVTWTKLQGRMPGVFQICKPFGLPRGQGFYDLALGVNPFDPGYVIMGGVQLWRWNGNLTQIAAQGDNCAVCVHSDQHVVLFDKSEQGLIYFGCDGGVYKSYDTGNTFWMSNYGYATTQFYSLGYDSDGALMAGSQDNGTWVVDELNDFGDEISGGDGFDCDFSNITDVRFATVYSQELRRSVDAGSMGSIVQDHFAAGGAGAGAFHTVVRLWETLNEPLSKDTIVFQNDSNKLSIGTGNGTSKTYTGTLVAAVAGGTLQPKSVYVEIGNLTYYNDSTDANNSNLGYFKALGVAGGSMVNYSTGAITVVLPTAPTVNTNVWVIFDSRYSTGTTLTLPSKTRDLPVEYTLTADMVPGDILKVQDPIQSLLAFSASRTYPNGAVGGREMWITRRSLDLSVIEDEMEWIDISKGLNPSSVANSTYDWNNQANCMEFSKDGDHLYVGVSSTLYRFSGLRQVYSQADADANITLTAIGSFSGYYLTGIGIDPNNAENVVVTLGNYGTTLTKHVYRSINAASATNTSTAGFTSIQGDLPVMPVYDCVIDYTNNNRIIVGTEFGVYVTENGMDTPSNIVWADCNAEIGNIAVYSVRQQQHDYSIAYWRTGSVYISTHARGMWRSVSIVNSTPEYEEFGQQKEFITNLVVYPNPMRANGTIEITLEKGETGALKVFSLDGKIMMNVNNKQFNAGVNSIKLNTNSWTRGTYFAVYQSANTNKVSKFIVTE